LKTWLFKTANDWHERKWSRLFIANAEIYYDEHQRVIIFVKYKKVITASPNSDVSKKYF